MVKMGNKIDEGVIKFQFNLKKSSPIAEEHYNELEKWRALFFRMSLIGEYPIEKLGYGNLSRRINSSDEFLITGSQTGHLSNLDGHHYTKINKCNLDKMSVEATGPITPSSETLTHHVIFSCNHKINYVFHIHNKEMWDFLLKDSQSLKTPQNISYGTKEMAEIVKDLIQDKISGIIVMEGHADGIISFAESSEQAAKIILDTHKLVKQKSDA